MSLTPEQHTMLVETHTILKRVDTKVCDHEARIRKIERTQWGLLSVVGLALSSAGATASSYWNKFFS